MQADQTLLFSCASFFPLYSSTSSFPAALTIVPALEVAHIPQFLKVHTNTPQTHAPPVPACISPAVDVYHELNDLPHNFRNLEYQSTDQIFEATISTGILAASRNARPSCRGASIASQLDCQTLYLKSPLTTFYEPNVLLFESLKFSRIHSAIYALLSVTINKRPINLHSL